MMRSCVFCLFAIFLCSTEACQTNRKVPAPMKTTVFGKLPDGREVHRYLRVNKAGVRVEIIDYGATNHIASSSRPERQNG